MPKIWFRHADWWSHIHIERRRKVSNLQDRALLRRKGRTLKLVQMVRESKERRMAWDISLLRGWGQGEGVWMWKRTCMVWTSYLCQRKEHPGFLTSFLRYEAECEQEEKRLKSCQQSDIKKLSHNFDYKSVRL